VKSQIPIIPFLRTWLRGLLKASRIIHMKPRDTVKNGRGDRLSPFAYGDSEEFIRLACWRRSRLHL